MGKFGLKMGKIGLKNEQMWTKMSIFGLIMDKIGQISIIVRPKVTFWILMICMKLKVRGKKIVQRHSSSVLYSQEESISL